MKSLFLFITLFSSIFPICAMDSDFIPHCPKAWAQASAGPDLNHDCQVDVMDLGILLSHWGSTVRAPADLNQDGQVDVVDLGILLSSWGRTIDDCGGDLPGTIKLAWDPNPEPEVMGYKLYYGKGSRDVSGGAYEFFINVGQVTHYTLTNLIKGQAYFVAVTAYDTSQNESGYSNEVSGAAR